MEGDYRYRPLIESIRDYASFILDLEGPWNAGSERIKGYEAQEIVGKRFSVCKWELA
jgi:hypothetical protein